MSCGAETEANTLLTALLAGKDFSLPDVDLSGEDFQIPDDDGTGVFAPITRLTNADLTTSTIDGSGTFDALMRGFKVHLREEFDKGRITGAEYTKSYIALTQGAMSNATQYLLGRDQAYWSAVQAQIQARLAEVQIVTARVQLETAKAQLKSMYFEALTAESTYALTKLRLSTESINYCTAKYQLDNLLPAQLAQLQKQTENLDIEGDISSYNLTNMLPKQLDMLTKQIAGQDTQNATLSYQLANILPKQADLIKEQAEAQRAQTLDTRIDGVAVTGLLGKQKDLYAQQIVSYQRDAQMKAAKLFTDAWITMKTIDEGLEPPTNFANASLDAILADIKTSNDIG